jgi:hypothetical protein
MCVMLLVENASLSKLEGSSEERYNFRDRIYSPKLIDTDYTRILAKVLGPTVSQWLGPTVSPARVSKRPIPQKNLDDPMTRHDPQAESDSRPFVQIKSLLLRVADSPFHLHPCTRVRHWLYLHIVKR